MVARERSTRAVRALPSRRQSHYQQSRRRFAKGWRGSVVPVGIRRLIFAPVLDKSSAQRAIARRFRVHQYRRILAGTWAGGHVPAAR